MLLTVLSTVATSSVCQSVVGTFLMVLMTFYKSGINLGNAVSYGLVWLHGGFVQTLIDFSIKIKLRSEATRGILMPPVSHLLPKRNIVVVSLRLSQSRTCMLLVICYYYLATAVLPSATANRLCILFLRWTC
jgi:hypothetical protein